MYVLMSHLCISSKSLIRFTLDFILRGQLVQCLEHIYHGLLSDLESTMIGVSTTPQVLNATGEKAAIVNVSNVAEELKTFGKECKLVFITFILSLTQNQLYRDFFSIKWRGTRHDMSI